MYFIFRTQIYAHHWTLTVKGAYEMIEIILHLLQNRIVQTGLFTEAPSVHLLHKLAL